MYLGINMLFLWVFGDNVEDVMGYVCFFVFYILCGIVVVMVYVVFEVDFGVLMIGVSGVILGIIGVYFFLFFKVCVWVFVFFCILI